MERLDQNKTATIEQEEPTLKGMVEKLNALVADAEKNLTASKGIIDAFENNEREDDPSKKEDVSGKPFLTQMNLACIELKDILSRTGGCLQGIRGRI